MLFRSLGYKWDKLYFASDFFDRLYEIARDMIRRGLAYVDDQSPEEMRANRGTLTKPGVNSPYRDRPVEENLDLFERMRAGEFADDFGVRVRYIVLLSEVFGQIVKLEGARAHTVHQFPFALANARQVVYVFQYVWLPLVRIMRHDKALRVDAGYRRRNLELVGFLLAGEMLP